MSIALPSLVIPTRKPLADQLLMLRRHSRLILACTIAAPMVAILILLSVPVTYSATGIVLYDPSAASLPGAPQEQAQPMFDEDAITASQGAIIASLPAASEIASQLDLARNPEFNPALGKRHFPFTLLPRPKAPSRVELAASVRRYLITGPRVLLALTKEANHSGVQVKTSR